MGYNFHRRTKVGWIQPAFLMGTERARYADILSLAAANFGFVKPEVADQTRFLNQKLQDVHEPVRTRIIDGRKFTAYDIGAKGVRGAFEAAPWLRMKGYAVHRKRPPKPQKSF